MPTPVTSNATEYLTRALQLLEKPRPPSHDNSWIQYAGAIRDDGTYCEPQDERACAWCTIGAVRAVTFYDDKPEEAYKYCLSILSAANPQTIALGHEGALPYINDGGSFERVRRMFQRGIALASKLQS